MPKVAIIVGSTRPGRRAEAVARWVHDLAVTRDDATFEIVDLADYPLPHLDEPAGAGMGPQHYSHPHTRSGRRRSPRSTATSSSPPNTTTPPRVC